MTDETTTPPSPLTIPAGFVRVPAGALAVMVEHLEGSGRLGWAEQAAGWLEGATGDTTARPTNPYRGGEVVWTEGIAEAWDEGYAAALAAAGEADPREKWEKDVERVSDALCLAGRGFSWRDLALVALHAASGCDAQDAVDLAADDAPAAPTVDAAVVAAVCERLIDGWRPFGFMFAPPTGWTRDGVEEPMADNESALLHLLAFLPVPGSGVGHRDEADR